MAKATILSIADIARILEVGEPSVRTYHNRATMHRKQAAETGDQSIVRPGDFPVPDGKFGNSPYWDSRTIAEWIDRRPGRGGHNKETHKRNLLAASRKAVKAEKNAA